jgi:hypothetical protein
MRRNVSKRLHNPIESVLNLTGVDDNEFLSDVDIEVLKLVLTKEPSRQRDFLEVRFGLELERLIGKLFSKFKNSTAGNIADIAVDRSNLDDAEEGEEVERPMEFLPDPASGPEGILLNLGKHPNGSSPPKLGGELYAREASVGENLLSRAEYPE